MTTFDCTCGMGSECQCNASRSRVPEELRSIPCPTCGEMMLVEGEGNGEPCEDCSHATPDRAASQLAARRKEWLERNADPHECPVCQGDGRMWISNGDGTFCRLDDPPCYLCEGTGEVK